MIEVTVIVGLPGSGKTHLAELLRDDETTVIDDMSRDPSRLERFVEHPTPKLIITDPTHVGPELIRAKMAKWLDQPHSIHIIAFENQPEQCYRNTQMREDSREISHHSIVLMAERYHPELYDEVRPVYVPTTTSESGTA